MTRPTDDEATLRAQLDEANFERSTLRGGCDSLTNQLVAARAEVARIKADLSILTWERDSWRGSYERVIDPHNRAIVDLTTTLAERDGEIARLEGRVLGAENMLRDGQWSGRGAFWHGPCCPNCGGTERTGHYVNCARAAWLAGCRS